MKILFITSTRIGDAALSSGLLQHLLQVYPAAKFTVAAGPVAAELFTAMPRLERLLKIKKRRWGWHWPILWFDVVTAKWDLVIDLRHSLLSYLVLTKKRYILKPRHSNDHRVVQLGHLLHLSTPPDPKLWASLDDEKIATSIIPAGSSVLAIAPTANWSAKQWPAEYFIDLIKQLTKPDSLFPQAKIAIFGAANERNQALPILKAIPPEQRIDLIGKASLSLVYAVLRRCRFFVGNDSGIMHLAAAAHIPTLGLFGPSRVELYHPWGEKTAAIRTPESFENFISAPGYDYRATRSLMGSLTVESVEMAARNLFKQSYGTIP